MVSCRLKYKNRGSVLITVIVILSFLSVLGLNMVVFLLSRSTNNDLELNRLQAYYLAEAGIAMSIYELKNDTDLDDNGVGNVVKSSKGDGTFSAEHDFQISKIRGIGEFNGIKRILEIRYSAL